jgi:hypothetical protein
LILKYGTVSAPSLLTNHLMYRVGAFRNHKRILCSLRKSQNTFTQKNVFCVKLCFEITNHYLWWNTNYALSEYTKGSICEVLYVPSRRFYVHKHMIENLCFVHDVFCAPWLAAPRCWPKCTKYVHTNNFVITQSRNLCFVQLHNLCFVISKRAQLSISYHKIRLHKKLCFV